MGVTTYGTTSTSWTPAVQDTGWIVSSWDCDDWGGTTDPATGRQFYVVTVTRIRGKYNDTAGNEGMSIITGYPSAGATNKLEATGYTLTGSYATYESLSQYVIGSGTTYWTGGRADSISGYQTTRTNGTEAGHTVQLSGGTSYSSSCQYIQLGWFGLPYQANQPTATVLAYNFISLSWTASGAPDSAGTVRGYVVYYSTNGGSTWSYAGSTTGTSFNFSASESTSYVFKIAAYNDIKDNGFYDATGPFSSQSSSVTTPASCPSVSASNLTSRNFTQCEYLDYASQTVDFGSGASYSSLTFSGTVPPGLSAYHYQGSSTRYRYVGISGTPTTAYGNYSITYTATNSCGNSSSGTISGTVSAASAPGVSGTTGTSQTVRSGDSVSGDVNGSSTTSYSISNKPSWVTFNTSTGSWSGTAPTVVNSTSYTFTVYLNNCAYSDYNGTQFSITVKPKLPVFTATNLTSTARVGSAYSSTVSASDASSYAITSGSLPTNLTLYNTGLVSGTPSAEGTSSGTIQAYNADSEAALVAKSFSITTKPPLPVWQNSSQVLDTDLIKFGLSYSHQLEATFGSVTYTGSSITYSYTGTLPAGLTMTNGLIAGTPNEIGTFTFQLFASNSAGESVSSQQYTIEIIDVSGKVNYYSGGQWVDKPVYTRQNGAWVEIDVKRYSDGNWTNTV